jgi:hypothetical protein
MPARNAGLSSHRPGKLNNSKWPLSNFFQAMTTKTSIPRGHQALWRHYASEGLYWTWFDVFVRGSRIFKHSVLRKNVKGSYSCCRVQVTFQRAGPKFVANLPISFSSSKIGRELRNEVRVHFNVWTFFLKQMFILNNSNRFDEVQTFLVDHRTKNFPLNC